MPPAWLAGVPRTCSRRARVGRARHRRPQRPVPAPAPGASARSSSTTSRCPTRSPPTCTAGVGVVRTALTRIYNGVDASRFRPARADVRRGRLPFDAPAAVRRRHGRPAAGGQGSVVTDPRVRGRRSRLDRGPRDASAGHRRRGADARRRWRRRFAPKRLADVAWLAGERDDVPELMQCLDLFVLPSLSEGISNTILEAMATGLPVIATRVGGNAELVGRRRDGRRRAVRQTARRWRPPSVVTCPIPISSAQHGMAGRRRDRGAVQHPVDGRGLRRGLRSRLLPVPPAHPRSARNWEPDGHVRHHRHLRHQRARARIERAVLARMNESQHHRGPGRRRDAPRAGPRRSGIAASRSSTCPPGSSRSTTRTARVCVVFNGEIYNYQPLIPELTAAGHRFHTRSDTEVIVHAWEEWGEACVERFRGMFAFALWDEQGADAVPRARPARREAAVLRAAARRAAAVRLRARSRWLAHGAMPRNIDPLRRRGLLRASATSPSRARSTRARGSCRRRTR